MDKELKQAVKLVNKLVKQIGRADIDWTVQLSVNSLDSTKVNYCAQIEAPANGLQPLTFVKHTYQDLLDALTKATEGIDEKAVEKAYLQAMVEQSEAKRKYFENKLKEFDEQIA